MDLNQEGLVTYYHSATRGRNQQYYQIIYGCMDLVAHQMFECYNVNAFQRFDWILSNLPWYKKALKTALMTNGIPAKTADGIVRHLATWLSACV